MSGCVVVRSGALVVGVLVLFAASAALAQPTSAPATTTTAPTTAPEPIVANPHYHAWAKHKIGTQVDLEMNIDYAGQKMTNHIAMTLQEVTPEQATVLALITTTLPGIAPQENKQTHTFNARVPESEAERALFLPSSSSPTTATTTTTTATRATTTTRATTVPSRQQVDVAGRTYDTNVREFTGVLQGQPADGIVWRSDQIPGGLVKMHMANAAMKVEMVVTKVNEK